MVGRCVAGGCGWVVGWCVGCCWGCESWGVSMVVNVSGWLVSWICCGFCEQGCVCFGGL